MESIHKLETTVEGWLKPIPHLPAAWRKWLAENSWWLTLIGVILSGLGVLALLGGIFTALSFWGATSAFLSYYSSAVYSGWWVATSVLALAVLVLTVVLSAMAINPLKAMKKKGWDLLFMTLIVEIVYQIVSIVINFSVGSFINGLMGGVISAAVGAYILFEIRGYFKGKVEKA